MQIAIDGFGGGAVESLGAQRHRLVLYLHDGITHYGNDDGDRSFEALDEIAVGLQAPGTLRVHDLMHFLIQHRHDLEHVDEHKAGPVGQAALIQGDAQVGGVDGAEQKEQAAHQRRDPPVYRQRVQQPFTVELPADERNREYRGLGKIVDGVERPVDQEHADEHQAQCHRDHLELQIETLINDQRDAQHQKGQRIPSVGEQQHAHRNGQAKP